MVSAASHSDATSPGPWHPGLWHLVTSIDPRARVLITALVMLGAFAAPPTLGVSLAVVGLALALACGDGSSRRRVLVVTLGGFVVAFVMNVWLVGLFRQSVGGADVLPLRAGLGFGARVATLAAWSQLLAITTRAELAAEALGALLAPLSRIFGAGVHAIIFQLQLVVRFTPLLVDEARRITECQRLRGLSLSGGWRSRLQAIIPLFTPVFAGALLRAGALAEHLIARGYRPGLARPYLVGYHWHARDTLAVALTAASLVTGAWA